MVKRLIRCDPDWLRWYLDDELSAGDQAELAAHLDGCGPCREALERIAAGSRLWDELRQLDRAVDVGKPGRDSAGPREEKPGAAGGIGIGTGPGVGEGPELDFLAPSENPADQGRLGPYQVIEVIGQGGMGVVLKAFDPGLSRIVAIKVLAPQMAASGAARRRFSREAKAAAAVVHDHIVAIYAVDHDPGSGLPYLVMPYIAGLSLQERIDREGPLPPEAILRIGRQTALGLAAAHAQGLVHRDIKPANILLENGLERVKITDFGLARAVDDASQSQSGILAGTPQYMSPEQASGETVDHRSDLFSLGSVLYAMCAGHSPFRARTTMGVLRRVCDHQPRPLEEINPEVPEELETVIQRLHAKDPARRYQSAAEVAALLGQQLAESQRPGARSARRRAAARPDPLDEKRAAQAVAKPAGQSQVRRSRSRWMSFSLVATVLLILLGLATVGTSARLAFVDEPSRSVGLPVAVGRADPQGPGERRPGTGVVIIRDGSPELIVGSGKPATKRWDLADFTAVEIVHPFQAVVTRGDRFAVTVTADDNVLDHVVVAKEGPRLRVELQDGRSYRLRRDALRVAITLPVLESLDLSHGARAAIRGFDAGRPLQARASHGSALEGEVGAGRLVLEATHGSEATLKGTAGTARLTASHGSRLRLDDLEIQDTELQVEHGSSATIHTRSEKRLKAAVHHGSRLKGVIDSREVALELEAEHGSQVDLRGSARRARIAANHASRVALQELTLDAAVVHLDQASSGAIHARSRLDYQIGHGSHLRYRGQPALSGSVSRQGGSLRQARPDEDPPTGAGAGSAAGADRSSQSPAGAASGRHLDAGHEVITINLTGDQSSPRIEGSGRPATRSIDVKDFTAIQIERLLFAEVMKGDSFQVRLTADDNVLGLIEAIREGSTLKLRLPPGRYHLRDRPRATITLPALEAIELAGAARATLQGFESDRPFRVRVRGASRLEGTIRAGEVELEASGASSLSLHGSARGARLSASGASKLDLADWPVQGEKLLIELSGASTAQLRGSARAAVLSARGASRLALADLALEAADLVLAGASHATIRVLGLLNYELSAASRLEYFGDPSIGTARRTGASSVARRSEPAEHP